MLALTQGLTLALTPTLTLILTLTLTRTITGAKDAWLAVDLTSAWALPRYRAVKVSIDRLW